MSENIKFNREREIFLNELRGKIDDAFTHSKIVEFIPAKNGRYTYKELLESSKDQADRIKQGLIKRNKIHLGDSENKESHCVEISNSHDFKDLLTLAYQKMGYSETKIRQLVEKNLEHEYAHHVAVLGHTGLDILYGVAFFKDPSKNLVGLRPYVSKYGSLNYETLQAFYRAPTDPSSTDQVISSAFV